MLTYRLPLNETFGESSRGSETALNQPFVVWLITHTHAEALNLEAKTGCGVSVSEDSELSTKYALICPWW